MSRRVRVLPGIARSLALLLLTPSLVNAQNYVNAQVPWHVGVLDSINRRPLGSSNPALELWRGQRQGLKRSTPCFGIFD
jgi:hypothetical protein